ARHRRRRRRTLLACHRRARCRTGSGSWLAHVAPARSNRAPKPSEGTMTAKDAAQALAIAALVLLGGWTAAGTTSLAAEDKAQITILYDAFGQTSTMQKDWGFAALIEYGGRRILFDTGNNA